MAKRYVATLLTDTGEEARYTICVCSAQSRRVFEKQSEGLFSIHTLIGAEMDWRRFSVEVRVLGCMKQIKFVRS